MLCSPENSVGCFVWLHGNWERDILSEHKIFNESNQRSKIPETFSNTKFNSYAYITTFIFSEL